MFSLITMMKFKRSLNFKRQKFSIGSLLYIDRIDVLLIRSLTKVNSQKRQISRKKLLRNQTISSVIFFLEWFFIIFLRHFFMQLHSSKSLKIPIAIIIQRNKTNSKSITTLIKKSSFFLLFSPFYQGLNESMNSIMFLQIRLIKPHLRKNGNSSLAIEGIGQGIKGL